MFAEPNKIKSIKSSVLKLLDLVQSTVFRNVILVFGLKGSEVLLNFTLLWLFALVLGQQAFGQFSILFSLGGLLAVFATAGQQILIIRFWNEYTAENNLPKLKGALIYSGAALLIGLSIFGGFLFFWLNYYYNTIIAVSVTLHLVTLALVLTTSHLIRTAKGIATGDGVFTLLHTSFPIVYLLLCYFLGWTGELHQIFLYYAVGASITILFHLFILYGLINELTDNFYAITPEYEKNEWSARSLKLWLTNGLEATNQFVDVLIVGLLMSPTVAGTYFLASRFANIFSMAAFAMYFYTTRFVPNLYYRKEWKQLDKFLDQVALILLVIIGAGFILILLTSEWFLQQYGQAHDNAYYTLIILSLGNAIVALAGPSGAILMFTGHEGTSLKILATTVFFRITGFFILIPILGIIGAAVTTAFTFTLMAFALSYSAKKLTTIDGSVMRLLAVSKQKSYKA